MNAHSAFAIAWLAIRPKTLPASISPILLGSALAFQVEVFNGWIFALALVCALFLQIAVNLANDFFDAKSGVDTDQRLGPKRVTQSGLVSSYQMRWALLLVCSIALITGLFIAIVSSLWLLLFGLLSLIAVFAYSGGPKPLASHALGELTVFFFFGWLAVGGTYFAHTQMFNVQVLAYASVAGLISAAIMLVNNIRDIATDTEAGKLTLAVRLQDAKARWLFRILIILALVIHLVVALPLGVVSLLPILILAPLCWSLIRRIGYLQGRELNALLASTAQLELAYCIMVSVLLVINAGPL